MAGIALAMVSIAGSAFAQVSPQVAIAGSAIPQFAQPLPLLNIGGVGGGINTILGNQPVTLRMCEFQSSILPAGALGKGTAAPLTWTWGYLVDPNPAVNTCASLVNLYKNPVTGSIDSYLGPVIVNSRTATPGTGSTDITFINDLGSAATTNVLAYKYSTDQTLHWADPGAMQMDGMSNMCMMMAEQKMFVDPAMGSMMVDYPAFGDPNGAAICAKGYRGPIAAAPHLHGGEQPPELDGSPDAWWTSDGSNRGHKYYTKGVVGEVASLPALPNPTYPVGAIVFDDATMDWYQVAANQTWAPYRSKEATYRYPNTQEPAPIWFHDHTLGATRLNVYAGLAGAYFIQDPSWLPPGGSGTSAGGTCTTNCLPANLQPLSDVIPLVLQDRMFDTNGQLFFSASSAGGILWALNPEHPYWNPEFVGDTIVINGKAWPFTNVQRKRYRFLFLNGSNARTYEMFLADPVTKVAGPPMWVIGTDGGYLDKPVKIDPNAVAGQKKLLIQPGERYEVIIDFGDPTWLALNPTFSGSLILKNTGRTPYPKGAAPTGTTLGQMMKFVVAPGAVADASYNPANGTPLRSGGIAIQRLATPATGVLAPGVVPAKTRAVTLNEVMGMPMTVNDPITGVATPYPGGPLEILVNNTKWGGTVAGATAGNERRPDYVYSKVNSTTTGFSELPVEGDTEVWEIINLTADAHPIHLHAVQFQVLNRQAFNVGNYNKGAYFPAFGTNASVKLPPACVAGVFCPGYGPPLAYTPSTLSGGKWGGNPDVTPYLSGPVQPPLPSEAGWKDTAINQPGSVTRYAVRWAPNALPTTAAAADLAFPFDPSGNAAGPGLAGSYNYVWHCHIIDHEDNEMMRPDFVTLNPSAPAASARSIRRGSEY